jgi:hypothetical protein
MRMREIERGRREKINLHHNGCSVDCGYEEIKL